MNQHQQNKVKAFIESKDTANAVKSALREVFLKSSGTEDVQTLASERMAINLLEKGFKELKKIASKSEQEVKEGGNVGL